VGGWKSKVAAAAVVLVLGLQTALLFRGDGRADLPAGDIYHEELVLKKHSAPYFLAEARPQAMPLDDQAAPPEKGRSAGDRRRSGGIAPLVSIAPLDRAGMTLRGSNLDGDDSGPPQISLSYPGTDNSANDSFKVNWPVAEEESAEGPGAEFGARGVEAVIHTVQDGDTLTKLAARYLGDAARQAEIFDANRSVLTSPDVLPIGAQLVIRSKSSGPAGQDDDSQWRPVPTAQN
jgi:hypothetical protein